MKSTILNQLELHNYCYYTLVITQTKKQSQIPYNYIKKLWIKHMLRFYLCLQLSIQFNVSSLCDRQHIDHQTQCPHVVYVS